MHHEKNNLYWHQPAVTAAHRHQTYSYKSCVIWFTGLSAAGKSTLANALSLELHARRVKCYVLDGDNIRHGLNRDLGFSPADRRENIRRIGEVAKLFVDAGLIVMTAFISPFRDDRDSVRKLLGNREFVEVHVKCSLEECERRDPKGIYKKAIAGEIKEFTGISSPYEIPLCPELVLDTETLCHKDCVDTIMNYLVDNCYLQPHSGEALTESAGETESPDTV